MVEEFFILTMQNAVSFYMKIVVLGSHGTGKSTLTKRLLGYLQEKYEFNSEVTTLKNDRGGRREVLSSPFGTYRWTLLPEAPFEATQRGFTMNKDTSLESELWIIAKQIEMEMRHVPWIADKCLIDILAYAYYLFKEEREFLAVMEKIIKKNINYDLVIYLPSGEFPIEDDGLRMTDPVFQMDIDKIIREIMNEMKIPYYTLRGDREERFMKAKKIIDETIR